ncbi:MAG: hypothetical protein WCR58_04700 [Bacteroidales bacterium]|jgi:hypothetical protein|nr:hypothetical protein [Bacteroidales bacterium]MDD3701708.1 hypothetical protein [Bacteroidales bacterium]MDY0369895.1 hypothetical protein [Bacteroidales bacterium]
MRPYRKAGFFLSGLTLLLLSFNLQLIAQVSDTTRMQLSDQLMSQLEAIAEDLEENIDFTDLVDTYFNYADNPVNVNSPELEALLDIYLLTPFQLESLISYIREFGAILSIYELEFVGGLDDNTIRLIGPLLRFELPQRAQKIKPKNVVRYGRHQVLMRVEQVLEQKQGYLPIDDSALWARPNSRYLGSPQKYYTRYAFNYRNRIRAGITMEKDPGEVFFARQVEDSLQRLLGNSLRSGFDFYSAHFFVKDLGPVKALALGDYHLAFGQGLTMWSGLAFGKSTDPSDVLRYGQGVKPNTSVNENLFFRGAAATFGWKPFEFTAFYSNKNIDASAAVIDSVSSEVHTITSLVETGLHRTVNELLKKGSINQQLYGARLAYRSQRIEIGYTLHQTVLSASLIPRIVPYNQFRFMGNKLFNQGLDYRVVFSRMILFGELGRSDNGGMAAIAGFMAQPAGFVQIAMAYRDYQKNYQNLFSTAFSEGTLPNNERGIFTSISAGIPGGWNLTAFADYFVFPWLRFATDAPSYGVDYYVQIERRLSRKADAYLRFRSKNKMANDKDPWNFIDFVTPYQKNTYRFHINYLLGSDWILKNRAELIHYQKTDQPASIGYILYQDVLYRPADKFYELSMRFALFQSDTYDSRVYTYENDVLYAFSIPAFAGKGTRAYLMVKLKAHPRLDIWVRVAQTWYADQHTIGSGLETIEGNTRTEAKLQLRWKL